MDEIKFELPNFMINERHIFLLRCEGFRRLEIDSYIFGTQTRFILHKFKILSAFKHLIFNSSIGGASSTVYAYLGEFHNDKLRPKIVSGVATFVAFGNMYLPGMAWLILPYDWRWHLDYLDLEFRPWRLLMLVYALPSFFFFLMLLVLPESPKFMMTQGKFDEVLETLKTMFRVNKGLDREDFMVSELIWDDMNVPHSKSFLKMIWRQSAPILRAPLRVKTFAVSLLQFGIFAS